jgi:hypothetical protein
MNNPANLLLLIVLASAGLMALRTGLAMLVSAAARPFHLDGVLPMNLLTLLLVLVIAAFAALTGVALMEHGYIGIFTFHFTSSAGLQVITDLVIVCTLAMIWMVQDARAHGRTVWPFLLLTLTLGAFGPLLYLLVGRLAGARSAAYA